MKMDARMNDDVENVMMLMVMKNSRMNGSKEQARDESVE